MLHTADMTPSNREPVLAVPDVRMTVCNDFVEGRQRLCALDVITRQHLSVLLFRWNRSVLVRSTESPRFGNPVQKFAGAVGRRSMPIDELAAKTRPALDLGTFSRLRPRGNRMRLTVRAANVLEDCREKASGCGPAARVSETS